MKKTYEEPVVSVIRFEEHDVITTSGETTGETPGETTGETTGETPGDPEITM